MQGGKSVRCVAVARSELTRFNCTYCFVPIAVETLGSIGDDASDFFHQLGRRIAHVTGERRATEFLLQRLSIAIQRGNAASVLGTVDRASQLMFGHHVNIGRTPKRIGPCLYSQER
jgi:hypothetical protein